MIYRSDRHTKMGANISKRREKKEGLMTQMKSKTESSPSRTVSPSQSICSGSTSPPPRNLATTLASPQLALEFRTYLTLLDEAACLEEGEVGRAETLQFLLDLRALEDGVVADHGLGRYFPTSGGGLVLDNRELWRECREAVAGPSLGAEGRARLAKAGEKCGQELEPLHVMFLAQRKEKSPVCQIISCIL